MPELGIDQLEKIVDAVGEAINVVDKVVHGGGIWPVFTLTDELSALGGLKGEVVLAQLKDLSVDERKGLLAKLKAKCPLIVKEVDVLDEVVDFGFKCYEDTVQIKAVVEARLDEGKALVDKIKGF